MENETTLRLDLIAAKAKMLAEDAKRGRLWERELQQGLSELCGLIQNAEQSARTDP